MSSLHRLERQIKDLLKSTSNTYITILFLILLFLSQYSSGTETTNTFMHWPKWAKYIPVFRPKRRKNHTLWGGGTYLYGLYKGVRPPPSLDFVTVVKDRKSPFPPQTAACLFVT